MPSCQVVLNKIAEIIKLSALAMPKTESLVMMMHEHGRQSIDTIGDISGPMSRQLSFPEWLATLHNLICSVYVDRKLKEK